MSLLQLLTTGKSLEGLKDAETRYRMTSQKLLPRFGSGKNPFCVKDNPAAAQIGVREETERGSASSSEPTAARDYSGPSAATVSRAQAARVPAQGWSFARALRGGWTKKLAGLLSRSGSKAVGAATPRPAKLPVQGELSLERIKVVRNDLSDTDLEVVRSKRVAAPMEATSAPRQAEKTELAGTAWRRLAARVLATGKR